MKNLFVFAALIFGLSSCTKDMIESDNKEQNNHEIENLSDEISSRSIWPMEVFHLVSHLDSLNFTNSNYLGCNEDSTYVSFTSADTINVSHLYGPLSCNHPEYLYTQNDFSAIVDILWQKIREECDGNAVIIDIDFNVSSFYHEGEYQYCINANAIICCDPILKPIVKEDPDNDIGIGG